MIPQPRPMPGFFVLDITRHRPCVSGGWCRPLPPIELQDRPLPSVVFTEWGVGPWPHGDRLSLGSEWPVVPRRGRTPSPKLQPSLAPADRFCAGGWRGVCDARSTQTPATGAVPS